MRKILIELINTWMIHFGDLLISNSKGFIIYLCVSIYNQSCQAKPTLVDIYSNKTLLYPYSVSVNKYRACCNTIDDPYTWVYILNKVKNMAGVNNRSKRNNENNSALIMWV